MTWSDIGDKFGVELDALMQKYVAMGITSQDIIDELERRADSLHYDLEGKQVIPFDR